MSVSVEMLWNRICAIGDEVHTVHEETTANAKDIAVVKERLNNHLEHQNKKTNQKLTFFAIGMASLVGLLAILI